MEAHKKKKMSLAQANTEALAVKMLERAKRLLKEDERNVEEAQRLRLEVTDDLLPPHKMYIMRKNPKSLLLDLDRRIQHARLRLIRDGGESKAAEISSSGYEKTKRYYAERYGKMAQTLQRRSYYALGWFLLASLAAGIILAFLQKNFSTNEFAGAFSWIRR